MSALSSFIKDPKNTGYDGEDSDEKILYIFRRSHITNLGWVLLCVVMAILPLWFDVLLLGLKVNGQALVNPTFVFVLTLFWYLIIAGIILFNYFNWYYNVYLVTSKKIVDFDFYGLTYKNISEALLKNVEDVTAKISGPFHMIFNVGDVFIQTAAENREFDFASVDDPGKIRDIISDLASAEVHKDANN